MEARAKKQFKKIIGKYSAITDPDFFKITSYSYKHFEYFGDNQEDAQEYIRAKMIYEEASILEILVKPNLTVDSFEEALEYYYIFHIFSNRYFLKKEFKESDINDTQVEIICQYLAKKCYIPDLDFQNIPDTSYFEDLPAAKLQPFDKILEKFTSKLFKVLILAANIFPKNMKLTF